MLHVKNNNRRKIIGGKKYNTDTAGLVGSWGCNCNSDLDYCTEELYKKKTGEFFLYEEGGPRTVYGVWHGNSGGAGCYIKPVTEKAAKAWAERRISTDEFEAIFGEVEE